MIPEGWTHTNLGKFVSLRRGHDLPTQDRRPGNVPIVGAGGRNGTHEIANVKGPGVVLGRSGAGFGSAYFIEEDFWAHNTSLYVTDFHGNDISFVYYLLDYMKFAKFNSGGAQPSLNRNFIYPITIITPPVNEQRLIAARMRTWDHAINLTERLIEKKRLRRKWLMQQLLTGKRRLPGFSGKWREVYLGDIFRNRIESGRTDLQLVAIASDRGVIPRDEIARKDSSSEDKGKYLHICSGDIGYNTMRMWQGVSGLSLLEGIVSPAYTIITPRKGIDGEFMAILFKFPPIVHLFYRYSQGLVSDTWNLKFKHFAEIKIAIPEEAEQKAIAKVFKGVDRELELHQDKADALRAQKKGLMQQLLTGKKRVKV